MAKVHHGPHQSLLPESLRSGEEESSGMGQVFIISLLPRSLTHLLKLL